MTEHDKSIIKSSSALTRFDPKARKELVVRALNAITEVKDADFYFFKGEEYRIQGRLKKAIGNYEKVLQIDPEHEDSLFWMGWCYLPMVEGQTGDDIELDNTIRNEKAASSFKRLKAIIEKKDSICWSSYAVYNNLGIAQKELRLYEEAIDSYERAIELNPENFNSYYNLGILQEHLDLYEEAVESLGKAIELNPDHAYSYYMLGLSQENLGIHHLAFENFETYLSLDVFEKTKDQCVEYAKRRIGELKGLLTYTYFYNKAIDLSKEDKYGEAIEFYQKAIDLNPEHLNSHCNIGCIKYRLGLYEEAITSLKHALELDSEHAASYYNIGLCQEALGNYKSAIESYEKCLSVANPESSENQQFIRNAKKWIKELREKL